MKKLLFIFLFLPVFCFGQLPAGKYLKVKDDGTGFELFTLTAVPGARLADSMSAIRAAMPSTANFLTAATAASTYSPANHTHAYNTLTGLPTLFTQAAADVLYATISHTHTGVYQPVGSYLVAADIAGKLNSNGSAASLTNFPTFNQNTTGTAAGLSAPLSFANGGISASAATSATTGTITVNMTNSVITCTPTGNMTLNASGGVAGQIITFSFTTSGTTSFTITFGTNFRKTGTARFFTVTFRCLDGTTWAELCRTTAQT